ncbi:NADH:flavin oxidoreductase/NADH oxidase [Chelativorans sp. Marseille-P2723]|uniref:NADH:flavin oxidoreductase/NADH oxidase n=1 Tax=Chelativorans sp. Marseille-P2723 TaxID=2709133 RepID=UPI00156DF663|nr:NADH:flavin oxidoreductase/NADH oxidase [Chelativorans sp. Marseille-P2723]
MHNTSTGLFSPYRLREIEIRNRIVASPMWQYCGSKGYPTDWHLMHLGRLAAGGAGLVFQEGTAVERRGCGSLGDLGLWHDDFIAPLSRIVRLIESCGATPGIQLLHCGRKARMLPPWQNRKAITSEGIADWDDWDMIAPSPLPHTSEHDVPREMSAADIAEVITAWSAAAARADQAGYKVLEIHAAHGYLIHQFLSPYSNQRGDAYGGSFENRVRFLMEIVEGIRAVWPAHKPLFVRLSVIDQVGWELEDSVRLARLLKQAGVDALDCSSGGLVGISPIETAAAAQLGYQVDYATALRRQVDIPTMAVGMIVDAVQADEIIRGGKADLVAIGRELLSNPNWPIGAAQSLGADPDWTLAPQVERHFLRRREDAWRAAGVVLPKGHPASLR